MTRTELRDQIAQYLYESARPHPEPPWAGLHGGSTQRVHYLGIAGWVLALIADRALQSADTLLDHHHLADVWPEPSDVINAVLGEP